MDKEMQTSPAGDGGDAATQKGAAIVVSSSAGAGGGSATSAVSRFAFGDAESVLDRRDLIAMTQSWWNGRWYDPPIPMAALARTRYMSAHHASALKYKVNQLLRFFEPTPWLTRAEFTEFALNFLAMGNGYFQVTRNLANRPLSLRNSPAIHTRVGRDGVYWWAPAWNAATAFEAGDVVHLREADLVQEIYGLPEYLSALQSGLLNEAATVFRRRYYLNGSHAGYILYVNEEKFSAEDAEDLGDAVEQAKGPGNFKNVFLHIPGGKEKGVQVIPVGEAAAKDEFLGIKNTTRDDVLAAHRVPPVLLGVIPQNTGGFGDVAKAADVFHFAEIEPLQLKMLEVNDQLGDEAVRFREYVRQGVG